MGHFVRKGIRILCITYYILYSFSVTLKKALASCVFSTLNSVEISCYLEFFQLTGLLCDLQVGFCMLGCNQPNMESNVW